MVLPIVGWGHPVLRKVAEEIPRDYPNLDELIANMFETMYNAHGVGLAAPQVNLSLRIFVVDGEPMEDLLEEGEETLVGFKKVFINPTKLGETGDSWSFDEGCLSIPDIREPVNRKENLVLKYYDENWEEHMETFSGMKARILQHEYDHLEGILFPDHISSLRRRMIKGRLNKIAHGQIDNSYPMKFGDKARA